MPPRGRKARAGGPGGPDGPEGPEGQEFPDPEEPGRPRRKVNVLEVLGRPIPKQTLRVFPGPGAGSPGELKIVCLNVNGVRSAMTKGLAKLVAREAPDVLCLSETKLGEKGFEKSAGALMKPTGGAGELELFPGYEHLFSCSRAREGYASSAVLVRSARAEALRCLGARAGIGHAATDGEGRVITLEFPWFYLVHSYVPNSGRGGPVARTVMVPAGPGEQGRQGKPEKPGKGGAGEESEEGEAEAEAEDGGQPAPGAPGAPDAAGEQKMVKKTARVPGNLKAREKYEQAIKAHILALSRTGPAPKPVVYCGDLNVAHEPIDLHSPETNAFSPGFTDEERGWLSALLREADMVDTFRAKYPDRVQYSWYSARANGKATGKGWRIDYFLVSRALAGRVVDSVILDGDKDLSDHVPIALRLQV